MERYMTSMNAGPCADACVLSYDGEAAEVYESNTRTARKEHWCCECDEAIQPGQRYEDVFMVFHGEPWEVD